MPLHLRHAALAGRAALPMLSQPSRCRLPCLYRTTVALHARRHATILASLSDVPSAYQKRIRKGRGPSSGKGKTSGRGHKGQKQHGKVPAGFEGGQTPLHIVKGKRGFKNLYVGSSPSQDS